MREATHAEVVAKRNAERSESEFKKYLARAGWANNDVVYMWKVAQKERQKAAYLEARENYLQSVDW